MGFQMRKFVWNYGIETSKAGKEFVGDCPLCGKEGHFHVHARELLWDCKSCGESGNHITFLNKFWESCWDEDSELEIISEDRGIKKETFRWAGVRKNPVNGEYVLPVWNAKENITNLYRTDTSEDSWKVLSSPSPCKHQLYLSEHLQKGTHVVICEGHWDALAMAEMVQHLHYRGDRLVKKGRADFDKSLWAYYNVVGVPGASTFNEQWLKMLKGRDIFLIYDNDKPGQQGVAKVAKMLYESPIHVNSLQSVKWDKDDPNDVRDILLEHGHRKGFEFLSQKFDEIDVGEKNSEYESEGLQIEPIDCFTFDELLTHYEDNNRLKMSDAIRDTLAVMCAMSLSQLTQNEQIGVRVTGPPGSAKSTLAECLGVCRELVFQTSKFTGLISGFGALKKGQQIAEKLNGKNLLIKDADVMTQMPSWPQIESEIRDALGDGVIRAEYKTGKTEEIYTSFSVTMCGTRSLLQIDDAQLGSRFLNIRIQDDNDDVESIVYASLKSQFMKSANPVSGEEEREREEVKYKALVRELGPPTSGFLLEKKRQLLTEMSVREPSDYRMQQLVAMGYLITWSRAKVKWVREDDLSYRPEKENPTRATNQLGALGSMLSLIFAKKAKVTIGGRVIQVLQRITRDTCFGFNFDVIEALYGFPRGLTSDQIAFKIELGVTQTRKLLKDLLMLDIVERKRITNPHGKGRKNHFYVLSQKVRETYQTAFEL